MSQFSTNEAVSLEKRIEVSTNIEKTNPEDINYVYEVDKCVKWILENNYQKVCLQFPDYLLTDAAEVVYRIEKNINRKVYVLGDTAYESCCIDYTAAKHISADAIIHFGATCFSKTENIIPYLKVYEKHDINTQEFCNLIQNIFVDKQNIVILIDTPYLYKLDEIREKLNSDAVKICSVEDDFSFLDSKVIYLGDNDRKLMNINLTFNPEELYYYNPKTSTTINNYEQDTKILKRRYFLIEKVKDSNTVGIVISTLAVRNYLKIIERVKTLAKIHSKKYYVISVGKPTVAKLANFPEVDIFVIIGCAMNEIYENRDFYKPIVTPYDLEAALNPKLENTKFSYDFNKFLTENNEIDESLKNEIKDSDVSLLSGKIRYQETSEEKDSEKETDNLDEKDKQLAVKTDGKIQVSTNYGAGYLSNRSWKGLEQNLGQTEPQVAQKGRKGIAQTYENEDQ